MEYVKYIYIIYIVIMILLTTFIYILKFTNLNDMLYSSTKGTIVAYWGNTAPKGWAICDGTNNTPDLRGRFIMGGGEIDLTNYQEYKNLSDDDEKEKLNTKNHIKKGNNFQTLTTKMNINPEPTNNTSIDLIQKSEPSVDFNNQEIVEVYTTGLPIAQLDPVVENELEEAVNSNFEDIKIGEDVTTQDIDNYINIFLKEQNAQILTPEQKNSIVNSMNDETEPETFTDSIKNDITIEPERSNFIINPVKYLGVNEFDEDMTLGHLNMLDTNFH